jgi:hypothetical protein
MVIAGETLRSLQCAEGNLAGGWRRGGTVWAAELDELWELVTGSWVAEPGSGEVSSSSSYRAGRFNLLPGRNEYGLDMIGADDVVKYVLLTIMRLKMRIVCGTGYEAKKI